MLEQRCVAHSTQIADELLKVHKLIGISPGDVLITQDAHDNDIYFILAGTVSIKVNGREVAIRQSGHHVGEMAMIDPAAKRSADVVAIDDTVLSKVTEPEFARIAQAVSGTLAPVGDGARAPAQRAQQVPPSAKLAASHFHRFIVRGFVRRQADRSPPDKM
jgi:CRP-like cAMP-binding protein